MSQRAKRILLPYLSDPRVNPYLILNGSTTQEEFEHLRSFLTGEFIPAIFEEYRGVEEANLAGMVREIPDPSKDRVFLDRMVENLCRPSYIRELGYRLGAIELLAAYGHDSTTTRTLAEKLFCATMEKERLKDDSSVRSEH